MCQQSVFRMRNTEKGKVAARRVAWSVSRGAWGFNVRLWGLNQEVTLAYSTTIHYITAEPLGRDVDGMTDPDRHEDWGRVGVVTRLH